MKVYWLISAMIILSACSNPSEESSDQALNENENGIENESDTDTTSSDDNGLTTEFHPNGNIKMEGKLNDNGNREGLWISYYENGTKWSESYYQDGKKDGHSLTFYPNGRVRYVGEYSNDQKTGTWTFYDEEGNLQKEETF